MLGVADPPVRSPPHRPPPALGLDLAKFRPMTVIEASPVVTRLSGIAYETDGASKVKITVAVPTIVDKASLTRGREAEDEVPELRNWTVVALVHDVVPMATSATKAVGVGLYRAPKFRPEIVTKVPPLVAMFWLPRTPLAAGESKVNRVCFVPTTAETVSTTLPGSLPAAFLPSIYELDAHRMVEADVHAVVAHASASS